MTTEQQNKAWACLPKETRDEIRIKYGYDNTWIKGLDAALRNFFGEHNITSDAEPEETLIIERKKVQELYSQFNKYKQEELLDGNNTDFYDGELNALNILFGDKCWPEKENSIKFLETLEEYREPVITEQKTTEIEESESEWAKISDLEPYTEQPKHKFKVGDKVRIKPNVKDYHNGYYQNGYSWLPIRDRFVGKAFNIVGIRNDGTTIELDIPQKFTYWSPIDIEPYVEESENKNIKEKELNLCELLKGHEGELLYSSVYGKCTLNKVYPDNLKGKQPIISIKLVDGTDRNISASGRLCHSVEEFAPISIFPFSLYEKYPLDAYSAWMAWKDEQAPKKWRAIKNAKYWYIGTNLNIYSTGDDRSDIDNSHYYANNYFRTKEDAEKAAELMRKLLNEFPNKK